MRKIELLVPASSLEVLKIAVVFGADAVYIGGEAFGLRAKAKNFSKEDHDAVDKKIKDGSLELKSSADVDEKTGDPSGISFDNLTVNFE